MDFLTLLLVLAGGFLCGLINTLASSGSAVSLPLLITLGLSAPVANGTNRVALLAGTLSAVIKLHRENMIDWHRALRLGVPVLAGSLVGAYIATQLSPAAVGETVVIAVAVAFVVLLTNPKRLLVRLQSAPRVLPWHYAVLFVVGAWGGFIVLDSATYLLFTLVLLVGYDLLRGNAMKNLLLVPIALGSLSVFWVEHQVNWVYGGVLSAGSVAGAWVGGYWATKEAAKRWIFRLLLLTVGAEIIHLSVQYFGAR